QGVLKAVEVHVVENTALTVDAQGFGLRAAFWSCVVQGEIFQAKIIGVDAEGLAVGVSFQPAIIEVLVVRVLNDGVPKIFAAKSEMILIRHTDNLLVNAVADENFAWLRVSRRHKINCALDGAEIAGAVGGDSEMFSVVSWSIVPGVNEPGR